MMRTTTLCVAALVCTALAIVAVPSAASAQAQIQMQATVLQVAAKKKSKAKYRRNDGRRIACFWNGCRPIPAGCTPTPEYDFWGNLTGYDTIVCR